MINKIRIMLKTYIAILNMNPHVINMTKKGLRTGKDKKYSPLWVHILLFVITIITTTIAGAQSTDSIKDIIISGLPFSITIMSILLSHEMGHYLTAKHFGIKATLPYFIPFPSIIGTMGAIIKIKSPINDKRALLFIGAMGPLIGFFFSLIASIIGIYLSEVKILPAITGGESTLIFGDSILFATITKIFHGEIQAGYDIYLSPYAWAGWIGLFVTSLNLMPLGQLDGSHIIYALIGRKQIFVGWTTFFMLIFLSFFWEGWIIWIALTLCLLMIGHPPLEDGRKLSVGETLLGLSCIAIFIISFIPIPVQIF